MDTFGQHLLAEYFDCDRSALNCIATIEILMRRAAEAAGATVVTSSFHRFAPQGVSGVVVVEESHLSIHTWPEAGYAAADIFTCGERCEPERAHEILRDALGAGRAELMTIHRGVASPGPSIRVHEHRTETEPELVAQAAGSG